MRVLVGPRSSLRQDPVVTAVAETLAGPDGEIISLWKAGVRNLSRPLSQAEVVLLRQALGVGVPRRGVEESEGSGRPLVGYVCRGVPVRGTVDVSPSNRDRFVAVADHADLAQRSPLVGPNDPDVGPRFPSMTGVYSPLTVLDSLGEVEGMIVGSGVVAGVRDDVRPTVYEAETATTQGHVAMSSELVPVVIVAAHMGLRVAAVLEMGI